MAYLTRLQMYRALLKTQSSDAADAAAIHPDADLVFKSLPNIGWRLETYSSGDSEIFIDTFAAEEEYLNAHAINTDQVKWPHRWGSPTNTDAGLADEAANLGSTIGTGPARRTAWWARLTWAVEVLKEIIVADADDPHSDFGSYGNPAFFDPADYTEIGYHDPGRTTLESAVETQLLDFRSHYTDDLTSQDTIDQYYDIAYASTTGKAQTIVPNDGWKFEQYSLPEFLALKVYNATLNHRPWKFTFHKPTGATVTSGHAYSSATRYCASRLVIRVFAVHNALYGSKFKPLSGGPDWFAAVRINKAQFAGMISNILGAYQVLTEDIVEWEEGLGDRRDDAEEVADIEIAERLEESGFTVHELTDSEIYSISINPGYNEYFTTTFNQNIITTVPIIHNLYLTEQYFEEISGVMVAPKIRALDTLITIITEDGDFDMSPNMDRPASRQAIAAANGDTDFGPFLQELLIKILIETPINILKSLCELIDPHVAITKMIRMGSMHAFAQGAKAIDASPVPEKINNDLSEFLPDADIKVTGEDLMGILVCLIEVGFTGANMGLSDLISEEEQDDMINFFPTATYKGGIDFTGTVSGMIMAPPLPFGLLYLLLELIKSKLNQQTENLDRLPRETGCEDDEGEDDS